MSRLIKVDYDPILGCVGWEFKRRPKDEASKKRKTQKNETSRKIYSNKND